MIFFLDQNEGWAACLGDKLCKTKDGGKTWNVVNSNLPNFSFVFVDSLNGWGSSRDGNQANKLLRTIDGGKTWKMVLDAESSIQDITFSHDRTALVSTWDNGIFRKDVRDEEWSKLNIYEIHNQDEEDSELMTGLKYVAFLQEGAAVGYGKGIWISRDSATSWKNRVSVGEVGMLNNASFFKSFIWVVGSSREIFFIDGEKLERHDLPINNYERILDWVSFEAVSFISLSDGWVVRNDKAIFQTKDGGKSWKFISRPSQQFRAVRFTSESQGWGVSEQGELFKTIDSGRTWKVPKISFGEDVVQLNSSET